MKRLASLGITGIVIAGSLFGASEIPVDLKWTKSYETYLFDTASGDLEANQFAVLDVPNGSPITFYRTDKSDPTSESFSVVSERFPVDLKGFTEVKVVGKAYYDEFVDMYGKVYRVRSDAEKYHALAVPHPVNPTKSVTILGSIMK